MDLLEDEIIGPLYRIVLMRGKPNTIKGRLVNFLTGPGALSVSRINQLISLYVTLIWALLLLRALFPSFSANHGRWSYGIEVALAVLTCVGFFSFGKTSLGLHRPVALMRNTKIRGLADQTDETLAISASKTKESKA